MKSDLLKNTLIVGVGRVLAQFTGLLLIPIYTSFLAPDEYGLGDLIITYAALAFPFLTLALEQGSFRFLVDARKDDKQKTVITSYLIRTVLILCSIFTVLALTVGHLLSFELSLLACVFVLSHALMNIGLWYARGLGDNKAYAIASIITGLLNLTLGVVFVAVLSMGVTGMIGALAIAGLASGIYMFMKLGMYRYINFRIRDKTLEKELLRYSLPLVPNSISWWLINAADRTLVTLMLGVAATGIYGVAVKFPAILVGLFGIFWISWHESASMHIDHKDRDDFFSKVTNTTIVLFGCIGLGILAVLSLIFDFVVGSDFHEAYLYIPLLMAGALGHSIVTMYGSIYAAKKQTKQILSTTLVAGLINVIVMLIALPLIGLFGAAIATAVAYLSMVVYRHYDVRKFVKITLDIKKIFPVITLSVIIITFYYINNFALNLASIVLVAIASAYLNKSIILSTKDLIWKKLQKS